MSSPAPWTVRSLLAWAREWLAKKGVDSARLDVELLLANALGCDRVRLYIDTDKPLTAEELARFKPLLRRRAQREPVAYILGAKEFYGRPFAVGSGAFIPRPETELLVQLALEVLPLDATVLDLCAGSGCVGVSIAAERPASRVDLVELSPEAVRFARENAARHAPDRAVVFEGDLFAALPEPRRYRALVTNPPYIPRKDATQLAPEILAHEPSLALFGGADGLDVVRRIVSQAAAWLEPRGFLGIELDPPQAEIVAELCERQGFKNVRVQRDLAGFDRHVTGVLG